jgi:hypothetical protein
MGFPECVPRLKRLLVRSRLRDSSGKAVPRVRIRKGAGLSQREPAASLGIDESELEGHMI